MRLTQQKTGARQGGSNARNGGKGDSRVQMNRGSDHPRKEGRGRTMKDEEKREVGEKRQIAVPDTAQASESRITASSGKERGRRWGLR